MLYSSQTNSSIAASVEAISRSRWGSQTEETLCASFLLDNNAACYYHLRLGKRGTKL